MRWAVGYPDDDGQEQGTRLLTFISTVVESQGLGRAFVDLLSRTCGTSADDQHLEQLLRGRRGCGSGMGQALVHRLMSLLVATTSVAPDGENPAARSSE